MWLTLLDLTASVARSGFISRYLLNNSGITKIKDMPELDHVMPTFHVCPHQLSFHPLHNPVSM